MLCAVQSVTESVLCAVQSEIECVCVCVVCSAVCD